MLLWIDGFDHYGTDSDANRRTRMLEGVYAEAALVVFDNANPRTGTYAVQFNGSSTRIRRIFNGLDLQTIGVGHAVYFGSLVHSNTRHTLASFRDSANTAQCSITVETDGTVTVKRGTPDSANTLAQSSAGVIVAGSYQHFECLVTIDATVGTVEVRVDGATVIDATGLNTRGAATTQCTQVSFGNYGSGANTTWQIDDLYCWDTTGSINNDFIGDKKVYTLYPDADTATADWSPNAGATGYTQIDDTTPDDATTYIESTTLNDVSQFGFEDLPSEVITISGVQLYSRALKTDAGDGSIKQSLVNLSVSPDAVADGSDHALTTSWGYYTDTLEVDPNTSALWTKAALNAAELRLTRVL